MSLETDALDAAALAATNQTVAANNLKDSIDTLTTGYVDTKNRVDTELNLVDNTPDVNKPVSTAQQAESDTKQDILVDGDNISTVNGNSLLSGTPLVIARGQVEIPILNYDDRGSLRTPVLPVPLIGDVVNIAHLGHFQYNTVLEYVDDDEMVYVAVDPDDGVTPIGQWVLTLPAYEWKEIQKMFENALLWEWMEDEALRVITY
tara:strand:+ start:2416 stop:3027 length:612 start_codon:yes stop_codon:yes gene_type:complete